MVDTLKWQERQNEGGDGRFGKIIKFVKRIIGSKDESDKAMGFIERAYLGLQADKAVVFIDSSITNRIKSGLTHLLKEERDTIIRVLEEMEVWKKAKTEL